MTEKIIRNIMNAMSQSLNPEQLNKLQNVLIREGHHL